MTQGPIPPPPMSPPPMSPMSPQMPHHSPQVDVSGKVNAPGIALMVTAVIGLLLQIKNLIMPMNSEQILYFMEEINPDLDVEQFSEVIEMATSGNKIFTIVGILLAIVVFIGGMKMRNMKNWGLCMAASIIALFPCTSPCCCLGIPIGIWALIVLMDSAVKDAFEMNKSSY